MKRLSLFPRSLRQLVTLSFVLILLPLLVLAWQAWQSLNALSAQAAHINRTTLVDARRSEAMTNAAAARTFNVLASEGRRVAAPAKVANQRSASWRLSSATSASSCRTRSTASTSVVTSRWMPMK